MTQPAPSQDQEVRRRQVFYIPGYDPFPPRRYRELYRKEGAAQAAISGYDLALSARKSGGAFGWDATATIHGQSTHAAFEVLVWSDIVRGSMARSIAATYRQMLRTAWIYIASGALWRLMRLRKGPVIAALYPVVMLIWQAGLALALGLWAGGLAGGLAAGVSGPGPGAVFGFAVGALVAYAVLRLFQAWDGRLFVYYLMHDFAHSAAGQGAYPPELAARLQVFVDRIAAALRDDVDEVLVVGHSSGAHLAVSILAELVRAGRVPGDGARLAFLSLGHVVPMVSFLPRAHRLRADLQTLSASDRLAWVDVTAPGDGCAFALCDPVAVSGVAPAGKRWPLVFSAQFTRSLSPARWRALRWRFFRLHFQYLCAFDRPLDYDYFQITAGPVTLATRYAGRPASSSRIERAVSKYTSVAA